MFLWWLMKHCIGDRRSEIGSTELDATELDAVATYRCCCFCAVDVATQISDDYDRAPTMIDCCRIMIDYCRQSSDYDWLLSDYDWLLSPELRLWLIAVGLWLIVVRLVHAPLFRTEIMRIVDSVVVYASDNFSSGQVPSCKFSVPFWASLQ
jgi:hypothetical protein